MILIHPITERETHAEPVEWLPGCAYFRCPRTGLQWLEPLPAGAPVYPDFSAYADRLLGAATPERMQLATPPNEAAAIAWVRRHCRPKARVVELFAESGRFAWRVREAGFAVCLADPLAAQVTVLRRHGFAAVCATQPTELPADWADAEAVVVLESIVRVPRPGAFLAGVRMRFPHAQVFLTAPSLRRSLKLPEVDRGVGYPPDFLTRWTVPALRELLTASGYAAQGRSITPGVLARSRGWRWRRRFFWAFQVCLMRAAGEYEYSVCAWGRPI